MGKLPATLAITFACTSATPRSSGTFPPQRPARHPRRRNGSRPSPGAITTAPQSCCYDLAYSGYTGATVGNNEGRCRQHRRRFRHDTKKRRRGEKKERMKGRPEQSDSKSMGEAGSHRKRPQAYDIEPASDNFAAACRYGPLATNRRLEDALQHVERYRRLRPGDHLRLYDL